MLSLLTDILWQLERKRKYRWSSNRTVSVVAKVVTLALALCLVYVSIYSTLDLGTNNNARNKPKLNNAAARSLGSTRDQYYDHVHNLISNGLESKKDDNSKTAGSIATTIINKLARNFHKADKDGNGLLDEKELTLYINSAIASHFENAMKENFDHYFQIDNNPRNGLVSWEEYMTFFFKTKRISGVTVDDVRNRTPAFMALSKDIKVAIARVQASWSIAASNDPEYLTVDEFLAFEHPEASPTRIIANVEDTLTTFDLDGDSIITTYEFDTTYKHALEVDPVYKRDKHIIDTDDNGEISRIELMRYMDPRSMHHSSRDAKELIESTDGDKDGRLSLLELVQKANIVIKSKFYDVGNNFHSQ